MDILFSVFTALLISLFSENIIFSKSLGTDTVLLISRNRKNIFGFGAAVTYMCTAANIIVWVTRLFFSSDPNFRLYEPLIYISSLCLLYFVTIMISWKLSEEKTERIKKYLHFAVFNSAVLGTMMISSESFSKLGEYVLCGFGAGIGYFAALFITSALYERLDSRDVPGVFRGYPLTLIFLGIISMALYGLSRYSA